ncbi:redoxin domain-containing protein [Candidatus Dependentiae bacterium]|nr:redoxin domain-containing protein [Candidatus Dependentiae bacterium]
MFFRKLIIVLALLFIFGVIYYFYLRHSNSNKINNSNSVQVIQPGIKAPKIEGITHWINTSRIKLEQLKGKVVLVDFWAYSCINCIRTLPYLKKWYEKYKDDGFTIIGVHKAEFDFEKDLKNVKKAVERFGLTYPIAMDNNDKTWNNYRNRYWPAHYLIDQNGIIQKIHIGEGDYLEMENAIRNLLGLSPISEKQIEQGGFSSVTPETYLGYLRGNSYHKDIVLKRNQIATYNYQGDLNINQVGIRGSWLALPEYIQTKSNDCILNLNFIANRVYLVMSSKKSQEIDVFLDNMPLNKKYYTKDFNDEGKIVVDEPRMYDILDLKGDNNKHILTLKLPKDVSLYAFTFGAGKE